MAKIVDHSLLPDFLIVGAMRGGTTSLTYYLNEHPEIFIPLTEVNFFNRKENWAGGPRRYAEFFVAARREQKIGEKTPAYSFKPNLRPTIPERIAGLLPEVKLLWCLRNPVDRAYSHYWHNVSRGRERESFESALERDKGTQVRPSFAYRSRGVYVDQIRSFLHVFPPEQMHVVISEKLFSDPLSTLGAVYEFLGVDSRFEGTRPGRVRNDQRRVAKMLFVQRGAYKFFNRRFPTLTRKLQRVNERLWSSPRPEMGLETRQALEEFYRPYNRELAQLLGVDLATWGWPV